MNSHASSAGRVESLHLHPARGGDPFSTVEFIDVEKEKGIVGNDRYFARRTASGQPGRRQISLIEREQLSSHAAALHLPKIDPGAARANIEASGINMVELAGQEVQIGEAVLYLAEAREPCAKMDLICQGLRELMLHNRQGVLAQVVVSGRIRVGDPVRPRAASSKEIQAPVASRSLR